MTDDRAEWLAWRRQGIGASDVAAIVGLSKWASPMSVWADKTGLITEDEDNDYLEYGRRAEPMIAGYFHDRTELYVAWPQYRAMHAVHQHHRATLDGLASETPELNQLVSALGVVEAKTAGWKEWDEIPDAYQCQGQWQMHVTGLPWCWFAVMHDRRFRIYELGRDDKVIRQLVQMVDAFWEKHVLGGTPPPADGHDATTAAIRSAFPEAEEGKAVDITEAADALARLTAAKAEAKAADERVKAAQNAIKVALGEGEVGLIDGRPAVTWKSSEREGYEVKPTTVRTLRVLA